MGCPPPSWLPGVFLGGDGWCFGVKHELKIVFTFKVNFDLEFKIVLTSYLAHPNPLHNIFFTQKTSIAKVSVI